jgi:hypothetical protein
MHPTHIPLVAIVTVVLIPVGCADKPSIRGPAPPGGSRLAGAHLTGCSSGEPPPVPTGQIILATHHKTGTFFSLALGTVLCQHGRVCCAQHIDPDVDVGDLLRRARPRFVFTMFARNFAHTTPGSLLQAAAPGTRLIHFVRNPMHIIQSSYHYHGSGQENHPVQLLLEGGNLSAGVQWHGTTHTYCRRTLARADQGALVLLRAAASALANRTLNPSTHHHQLLSRATLRDGLAFEAAWNWCEVASMIDMAESACRSSKAAAVAVALQLEADQLAAVPGATARVIAAFLRGADEEPDPGSALARARAKDIKIAASFRATEIHGRFNMTHHSQSHTSEALAQINATLHEAGSVDAIRAAYEPLLARYTALRTTGCFVGLNEK